MSYKQSKAEVRERVDRAHDALHKSWQRFESSVYRHEQERKNEGILQMSSTGLWAVHRPGRTPVEIGPGEEFRVEVKGAKGLQLTRMRYRRAGDYCFSLDGYPLHTGLRAAFVLRD